MAGKGGNWSGLGFNPAPGESGTVHGLSASLAKVSERLISVHDVLDKIAKGKGEWTGEAADAFAGKLGKLPGYLKDAGDSITEASRELDKWHRTLTENRPKAEDLERQAVKAKADKKHAEEAYASAKGAPDLGLAGKTFDNQAALDDAQRRYNAARKILDEATDKVNNATTSLNDILKRAKDLHGDHENVAQHTSKKVRDAADSKAPPEPAWYKKAWDWVKNHGADLLSVAAAVVGVAALFLPILAPVAVVLSLAAFAGHAAQYGVSGLFPPGKNINNWLTLGGDALGAIPVVGAVSRGVSAGAKGAKFAASGAKVTQGLRAGGTGLSRGLTQGSKAAMENPLFAKGVGRAAAELGASPTVAANVAKGAQGTVQLGLAAPTAVTLGDFSQGASDRAAKATGANTAITGAGGLLGSGRIGKGGVAGSLLGIGSLFGAGAVGSHG